MECIVYNSLELNKFFAAPKFCRPKLEPVVGLVVNLPVVISAQQPPLASLALDTTKDPQH